MGIRNVGIVFSPTLNIPSPVFSLFLTDFGLIFSDEYEEASAPAIEVAVTAPLTPEDIRSPRHQIFSNIPTPSYNQETFPKNETFHEQTVRVEHDVGFIPLQPSYAQPLYDSPNPEGFAHDQPQYNSIVPGSESGIGSRKLGTNSAAKARRRESSMLFMGNSQKPNTITSLRGESGKYPTISEQDDIIPNS